MKKIIVAQPHGYCGNDNYGVLAAIKIAQETAQKYPRQTYLLGEIVHNQHVVDWLEKKHGVKTVQTLDQIPQGATVIIRAHGASPKTYQQAQAKKLHLVDATCPFVAQVQKEVQKLSQAGKIILYLASDKTHDEALGVASQAPASVIVITLKEIDQITLAHPEKTVVLTQTTLSVLETQEALQKLRQKYPQVSVKPHICLATTQRQKAVINLAQKTKFVIIVGSPQSSNSNRLQEVAEKVGSQAFIVDTAADLNPGWFKNVSTVGISSGASTPEWLLEAVIEKIKKL